MPHETGVSYHYLLPGMSLDSYHLIFLHVKEKKKQFTLGTLLCGIRKLQLEAIQESNCIIQLWQ
jgi:hypothetical protein